MDAGLLAISAYTPARDRQGRLVSGARMDVFVNRTTTRAAVYADAALTTPLPNPVIANSSGQFPAVWAQGGSDESPTLYTVGYALATGGSIGNPSVFDDVRPSVSLDLVSGDSKADLDGANVDANAFRHSIGADLSQNVNFNLGAVGAAGDNETDDTAAINAAIAWCNTQVFPVDLHFPRGFYKITSALAPVRGPTRLVGSGPRNTVVTFYGNYDCITFAGNADGWIGHCGLLDMGLFCAAMTGGRTIVADNAIGGEIRNILCDAPFNFAHLQQASNWTVSLVDAQPVRGEYGIKWIGTNTVRNGRIDKSDVLTLRDVTLHGLNVAGAGSTADALWLEGYVHTLVISNVRLLAMKRGVLATNQSAVPANLVPSFALGAGLEIENPYHEAIRLEAMTGLWVNGLFCVGSTADCGIHIGANARQVHLHGGRVAGNFTDGIYSEGNNVSLTGIDVYNNSRFASDAFSGVRCAGGSTFLIGQCVIGKPDGEPAYTERQKFGIANVSDATLKMAVVASDLTGNVSGATSGAMSVTGCFTV